MCGIVGSWHKNCPTNYQNKFSVAIDLLYSRGPDDKGEFVENNDFGNVALGIRRLSIIDLSSSGKQPMQSNDRRYTIIFNGEIYNFKELKKELEICGAIFKSNSDTEVLLNAWIYWGKGCLNKIIGMFAFVIFDKLEQILFCARDHFGMKPFFYFFDKEKFIFASEIKVINKLVEKKTKLNWQTSYDYLVFGEYESSEQTFFQNIYQLSPAHLMKFSIKKNILSKPERYWWPSIKKNSEINFVEAKKIIKEKIKKNINIHLRSDVPVGFMLSGGIDSSSIVCVAKNINKNPSINTFSYVAENTAFNEKKWIDIINKKVGAVDRKFLAKDTNILENIEQIIYSQGEPFRDTSIVAQYLVCKMAKSFGIKVLLEGQGADELFAGYNGYPASRVLSLFEEKKYLTAIKFIIAWSRQPNRSLIKIIKLIIKEILPSKLLNLLLIFTEKNNKPKWINYKKLESIGVKCQIPKSLIGEKSKGRNLVATLRKNLCEGGLLSLLRHGDRNSMSNSIESRMPFLTHDLVDYVLTLPEDFLISDTGKTKYILRESMREIVPDEILNRKDKIGFKTPDKKWIKLLEPKILSWIKNLDQIPFINKNTAKKVITNELKKRGELKQETWRIINFCKWYEVMKVDLKD